MKVGDKVIDKLKIINHGFPMYFTKLIGEVATVEFFDSEKDGLHTVIEIEIARLKTPD